MTKLETLDVKFSSSLVKKNLINSFLFVLKFLFSQPSKKFHHSFWVSLKEAVMQISNLTSYRVIFKKKFFCKEVPKNRIKKKLHAAMDGDTPA